MRAPKGHHYAPNWDLIPEGFKFAARDRNGSWWAYGDLPRSDSICSFRKGLGEMMSLREEHLTLVLGKAPAWNKSLRERPSQEVTPVTEQPMMKSPDWNHAPEWATCTVRSASKMWYWLETRPIHDAQGKVWQTRRDCSNLQAIHPEHVTVEVPYKHWYESLIARPGKRVDWVGHPAPTQPTDPVNWPSHYNQGEIECIDAMRAAFGEDAVATFCRLNAFKYQWRSDHKGSTEQDIQKAIWYLRFALGDDPRKDARDSTGGGEVK